ncbi:MAG: Iron-sulfur flavoprotein [Syntrophus sp. PtaB.Bin138]|nr:MAG: Iron-sulfur flavoprotein [Syntrophus sp. PtaB.Bin138]
MKVLGINASPRGSRSQTLRLVKAVLDGAESRGLDVELVDLGLLEINYCKGCFACYRTGRCPQKDDFQDLYAKMLGADGLVMGSPNYIRSVTAQMKSLFDRMADTIHCQLFSGKYGAAVATSGGLGQDHLVREYLSDVLFSFGSFVSGTAGTSMAEGPEAFADAEKRSFQLGESLAEDLKTGKGYPDQQQALAESAVYFHALVQMHRDEWLHEAAYWDRITRQPGEGRQK